MPDPKNPDQPEAEPTPSAEPTQPIEAVTPAVAEGPESFPAAEAPAAEPTQALPPATQPAPAQPVVTGPQPAIIAPTPRGPRFPGARRLWGEATASTGARVATIIALALATVVVIGGLTSAAVALARHGNDGGPGDRTGQVFDKHPMPMPGNGNGNGRGLGRDKQNNGNGNGNGNGQGQLPGGGFGPGGPGNGQGVPGGPLGGGMVAPGTAGSLHGEFTQGQPATTYLFQRGAVTAVSSTSMTVKSGDGFTATYAVSGSTEVRGGTAKQVTVGTDVLVIANKQGSAAIRVRVFPSGIGIFGGGATS